MVRVASPDAPGNATLVARIRTVGEAGTLEGAETRRFYATMLLERNASGDRDRARTFVEEALPVYRRVGMPRHEELARTLLTAGLPGS